MASEFKTLRRVEFADTDMAGIVHFAHFFRFMEAAEHEFFRSLGLRLHENGADGRMIGFARVRAECDYLLPLHYQDVMQIHVLVAARRERSLTYRFVFHRVEDKDGPCAPQKVAVGALTVVCVQREPSGRLRAAPLAPELTARIEPAPAGLLEENP